MMSYFPPLRLIFLVMFDIKYHSWSIHTGNWKFFCLLYVLDFVIPFFLNTQFKLYLSCLSFFVFFNLVLVLIVKCYMKQKLLWFITMLWFTVQWATPGSPGHWEVYCGARFGGSGLWISYRYMCLYIIL